MGDQTHFWTKWRTRFRICRICVLLFILALVCAVLWLNQIGLPGFVKRPLIEALRQRGITLQFVRLRVNFVHGLVADNVHIGGETSAAPMMTFQQVQLQMNYHALMHRKWQLDGIVLRQGKLVLPISSTNARPRALTFDHIQTELRFETNDVWALDNFQAQFAGAEFALSGRVSHASAVANWQIFHRAKAAAPGATERQWKRIGDTLSQIHFNKASLVSLRVNGDARNVNSFFVFLTVSAPGVFTPWGGARDVELVAHSVAHVQSPGTVPTAPLAIEWKARLDRPSTRKAAADFVFCAGSWRAPVELEWQVRVARLRSPEADAGSLSCIGSWHTTNGLVWQAQATQLTAATVKADSVSVAGSWRAPLLEISNLTARLGGGEIQAAARLNTQTRDFWFTNSSCFNLSAISGLLTEKTREFLGQFKFGEPISLQAAGSLTLPPWSHATAEIWRTQVQPTVRLNGQVALTNIAFSHLNFDEINTRFSYSNELWTLPEALIAGSAGRFNISGSENDATRDYEWHLHGGFAPGCIEPFLTSEKAVREFRNYRFPEPILLDADVRGRLNDFDSIHASGHVAANHFSLHGVPVDHVQGDFHYAHLVADFYHPTLEAGAQRMKADGIRLDWPGDRIYFTNGLGTADPQLVAKAIGPIPEDVMKPYHFLDYPTAHVNGYAPLRDATNADLDFLMVGTAPFQCLEFKTSALSGEVHWAGQTLVLTNIAATLYGGDGQGHAHFDFGPSDSAWFSFIVDAQNVDLHLLAGSLDSPTNHTEGSLNGHFVVTSGNSRDWRTCNGYGHVDVRNGLLWDVPIFGMLSPGLDAISPGLGNSRATEASAQFFMTNGVISTDSLQVHTALMRMDLAGTMDLRGNVKAHITAQLLRDVPGVGPLFSIVTWPVGKLFEGTVTGTWKNPKVKLTYILPRVFFNMLHPFHTLEDLLPNNNQNPKKK